MANADCVVYWIVCTVLWIINGLNLLKKPPLFTVSVRVYLKHDEDIFI